MAGRDHRRTSAKRAPRLVEQSATIPVRPDGTVRILCLSDTHSRPHPEIGTRIAELAPDAILHGGDIGELSVLEELGGVAPLYAVRGNIDMRAPDVPDIMIVEVVDGERVPLRILLTHIAVYGPNLRADVAKRARAAGANLVVCGHSHVPFIGSDRGIAIFNPGSIGPRRFALPIVFGTIDLSPSGVKLAHVSCETGAKWMPP